MVVPSVFMVWSLYGVPAEMQSFGILLVGFMALLSWEEDAIRAGCDTVPKEIRGGTALQE